MALLLAVMAANATQPLAMSHDVPGYWAPTATTVGSGAMPFRVEDAVRGTKDAFLQQASDPGKDRFFVRCEYGVPGDLQMANGGKLPLVRQGVRLARG